jgi:hypothetical protein
MMFLWEFERARCFALSAIFWLKYCLVEFSKVSICIMFDNSIVVRVRTPIMPDSKVQVHFNASTDLKAAGEIVFTSAMALFGGKLVGPSRSGQIGAHTAAIFKAETKVVLSDRAILVCGSFIGDRRLSQIPDNSLPNSNERYITHINRIT